MISDGWAQALSFARSDAHRSQAKSGVRKNKDERKEKVCREGVKRQEEENKDGGGGQRGFVPNSIDKRESRCVCVWYHTDSR